jgi:ketosteroid isomerase-like protein
MNKDITLVTKQLAAAYNKKDWTAFADLLHPNAVFESPDEGNGVERYEGKDAILDFLQDWTAIIPDDKVTFLSFQRASDVTVICEVVWIGTHSGKPFEWQGLSVPADGNTFTNRGTTEYTMRDS